MPGRDMRGPLGEGPATGRGLGPCGRGLRHGRRGFGFGYRQLVELTKEQQKQILEQELKDIKAEKQEIENKLKEWG